MAVVQANSSTLSYATNVNANGEFMIMGLLPGMYNVTITPALPLLAVTKTNITVTAANTTDIGIIVL
jgi:hypothetical protein